MKGCCSECGGTGVDPSSTETNGRCWDCYGTGHLHVDRFLANLDCRFDFLVRTFFRSIFR